MNDERSKSKEILSENEEKIKYSPNGENENDNAKLTDDNFTILEENPQQAQTGNISLNIKDNSSARIEQSSQNTQTINNSNENESNTSSIDPMQANVLNFLKRIQEMSYTNDENSVKFFEETVPNCIYFFLASK